MNEAVSTTNVKSWEELGLPILHGGREPLEGIAGATKELCDLLMVLLVSGESHPARPRLEGSGHEKQRGKDDAEVVVLPPRLQSGVSSSR
jgi:hypothetical protein